MCFNLSHHIVGKLSETAYVTAIPYLKNLNSVGQQLYSLGQPDSVSKVISLEAHGDRDYVHTSEIANGDMRSEKRRCS